MEATLALSKELVVEMVQAGILHCHKQSKTNPRMRPYIGGNRNEIEILDPEETLASLDRALAFLREKVRGGGLILVVGTTVAARAAIASLADALKFPAVTGRWLGGTLTNFNVIKARLGYYEGLMVKRERGELAKYTKKEQHEFDEEIKKLAASFGGLRPLSRLPDVLFVVDGGAHETAVREAERVRIPVVAIIDSDDDPDRIQYPIFANDHTKSSVEWIVEKVREALRAERASAAATAPAPQA